MDTFEEFRLTKPLQNAVNDLGFERPTPIQVAAFPAIMSGKNVVGIAQTGTGKTLAYLLPILQEHQFSKELNPRVLVLVPTRELVDQVVEQLTLLTRYMQVRILGVYGGSNIETQKKKVAELGANILVATPGRLYDLVMAKAIKLTQVKKLVIDEVDVMLDLGFRHQLTALFELMPQRRQNIMFSATMTDKIDRLIDDFFVAPQRIAVALSGTPLDNIVQHCYLVKNFYTKVNLLVFLLEDRKAFSKVLVFASGKRIADRLFGLLEEKFGFEVGVIHADKSQNVRNATVERFDQGRLRVLVTTDLMARGIDVSKISHVIQMDAPQFPENYMHRIGRTGRAESLGHSILLYTVAETEAKAAIEQLMNLPIPQLDFPEEVEISKEVAPEERVVDPALLASAHRPQGDTKGPAFHEKKDKNKKTNATRAERKKLRLSKHKKPITRGDKFANLKKKR